MATVIHIAYILHKGFMKYVPKNRIKNYEKEFASRKRFDSRFVLKFFPKYVDFDKWAENPKEPYDEYLFDYWLYDVPVVGIEATSLLWKFRNGLKKDFKRKKDTSKKINKPKPKQTSQNSSEWHKTSKVFICGPGGCEVYTVDPKSSTELENKKKSTPKSMTGKQIAQEIVKEIKKDPDYAKKATSIFEAKKNYQTEEEVLYRENRQEETYKTSSKEHTKKMEKYKAMLKAMTPEMRKELEGYMKDMEKNKNPKVREMVKKHKEANEKNPK